MDWKEAQREDPLLAPVIKNLSKSETEFRRALVFHPDKSVVDAYVQKRPNFIMKDGLLYLKDKPKAETEEVVQFVVYAKHRQDALNDAIMTPATKASDTLFPCLRNIFGGQACINK